MILQVSEFLFLLLTHSDRMTPIPLRSSNQNFFKGLGLASKDQCGTLLSDFNHLTNLEKEILDFYFTMKYICIHSLLFKCIQTAQQSKAES